MARQTSDSLAHADGGPLPQDTLRAGPRHVAIIMDGNGRWATMRGRPRLFGHHAGAKRVREIVEACPDLGVKYLTIFAFSTENWKRTQVEVAGLMSLFRRYIIREAQALLGEGVRVRFIGDRLRLDAKLQSLMDELEALTEANDRVHLTIAINYGSRDEILDAARALAADARDGRISPEAIDEAAFASRLTTAGLPDPDLLVRTAGEMRLSNYLLWQLSYAELYVTDVLWPDFGAEELKAAIRAFASRKRRFGGLDGSDEAPAVDGTPAP